MSQEKRTNILITLAGRAADPHRPHPCDDDRRSAVGRGMIGVITKQSLVDTASGSVLCISQSSRLQYVPQQAASRYLALRPLYALD
jgi:hypothetical protein